MSDARMSDMDGLAVMDLTTGERRVVVQYTTLFEFVSKGPGSFKYDKLSGHQFYVTQPLTETVMKKCKHWINHMEVGGFFMGGFFLGGCVGGWWVGLCVIGECLGVGVDQHHGQHHGHYHDGQHCGQHHHHSGAHVVKVLHLCTRLADARGLCWSGGMWLLCLQWTVMDATCGGMMSVYAEGRGCV